MKKLTGSLAVLGLLLGATGQAGAVLLPIDNPSFEASSLGDGAFTMTVTGWTVTDTTTTGVWNPSAAQSYGGLAPGGSNVAFSNGGALSQTLTTAMGANKTYTLSVYVGNRADFAVFPGYQIQLLAGSTVLAQCVSCVIPTDNTFALVNVSYTTASSVTPGQLLGIRLASDGGQVNFDRVQLENNNNVPEPGTLLLLGFGLAGIGFLGGTRRFRGAQN